MAVRGSLIQRPYQSGDRHVERGPHALFEAQPADGFPEHVLDRLTPLGQPELAAQMTICSQGPANGLNCVRHGTSAFGTSEPVVLNVVAVFSAASGCTQQGTKIAYDDAWNEMKSC